MVRTISITKLHLIVSMVEIGNVKKFCFNLIFYFDFVVAVIAVAFITFYNFLLVFFRFHLGFCFCDRKVTDFFTKVYS